jgi:glycosyltransferase involved in cell wall biosynthesis
VAASAQRIEITQSAPALPEGSHCANASRVPRIAFVTNFCPHYRVKTFELLAAQYDVDYLFYSDGGEWYWQENHGTRAGEFQHEYLHGITLRGTRITPALVSRLMRGNYDAIVAGIDGRFALVAAFLAARMRRLPFVLWTGIWSAMDTPFHRLFSSLLRGIYRHADAVVVYGEHVKRHILTLGVAEEKVFVAPHAVDNDEYSRQIPQTEIELLRAKLRIAPGDRVILYLGRLEPIKGLGYLLDAFRRIRTSNAVLVIAGDGSERANLQSMAAEFGIEDRVRFPGYVPPESALAYHAMAYALVLPSVTTKQGKELWGLVVNEAMNQGVPVIASNAVGAAAGGLVLDRVNGLVVAECDSIAIAGAIRMILDSPALHDEMSRQARRTIAQWGNAQMVDGFRQAIDFAVHRVDPVMTSS